ncbi:hypothetical protein ADUPG1_008364, partial [Aduncisulcus paluster]
AKKNSIQYASSLSSHQVSEGPMPALDISSTPQFQKAYAAALKSVQADPKCSPSQSMMIAHAAAAAACCELSFGKSRTSTTPTQVPAQSCMNSDAMFAPPFSDVIKDERSNSVHDDGLLSNSDDDAGFIGGEPIRKYRGSDIIPKDRPITGISERTRRKSPRPVQKYSDSVDEQNPGGFCAVGSVEKELLDLYARQDRESSSTDASVEDSVTTVGNNALIGSSAIESEELDELRGDLGIPTQAQLEKREHGAAKERETGGWSSDSFGDHHEADGAPVQLPQPREEEEEEEEKIEIREGPKQSPSDNSYALVMAIFEKGELHKQSALALLQELNSIFNEDELLRVMKRLEIAFPK